MRSLWTVWVEALDGCVECGERSGWVGVKGWLWRVGRVEVRESGGESMGMRGLTWDVCLNCGIEIGDLRMQRSRGVGVDLPF